ncbi:MAG: hypothetical protein ABSE57_10150 [Bryobacteraceae bacterium]|jgi:hypothetical protein
MSLTKLCQCLIIVSGVVIFDVNLFPDTLTIDATDDIYGAGQSTLPATIYPGTFPPSDTFSADPNEILTFSSVTGMVGCNFVITNGPDGPCWPGVNTTVTSYGGLSGIDVDQNNMFLVGVFLDASEPSGPGPAVLSYNYGTPGSLSTSDPSFSPALDEVFFIGDGLTGTGTGNQQIFNVPAGADRLYLGFADSFDSVPSYYADNVGSLTATFEITTATPEPAYGFLLTGGLIAGALLYRRKFRTRVN